MRWIWGFILSIDGIFFIGIMIAVIYFILTTRRKKYKYKGFIGHQIKDILKPSKSQKDKSTHSKSTKRVNKHEERCREIFESIFKQKFKSVRPKWLQNPVTGRNLELDGFCSHIKTKIGKGLCFEYDGQQHSKYTPHFHRGGPDEFIYQTKKDDWKDHRCKQEGVLLIRIPHFVAFQDLERYIHQQVRKVGLGHYIDNYYKNPSPSINYEEESEEEENLHKDEMKYKNYYNRVNKPKVKLYGLYQ